MPLKAVMDSDSEYEESDEVIRTRAENF